MVLLIAVEFTHRLLGGCDFFVHMFQHLLLMFAVGHRRWLRSWSSRCSTELPAWDWPGGTLWCCGCLVTSCSGDRRLPAAAVDLEVAPSSVVMLVWAFPRCSISCSGIRPGTSAVHGLFLWVLFWLLNFIPSPPFQRRMPLVSQAAALIGTNLVMWMLAMAMSIFSEHAGTRCTAMRPVTLPLFADQEIGAAILLGRDFWAIPRSSTWSAAVNEDGGLSSAIDQILHRGLRLQRLEPSSCRAVPGSTALCCCAAALPRPTSSLPPVRPRPGVLAQLWCFSR